MAVRNYALTLFLGLNTEVSDFLLKDYEASDLSNVDVDYRGYLRNRAGINKLNDTAITGSPNILSLYGFYKDGVSGYRFICAGGTKLYDSSDGSSWSDLATGLTTGGRWNFITHNNVCYGADDENTPQKITESGGSYSSTNWTCATNNPPNAAPYIIVHRDRIFIAGDPNNASLIQYTTTAVTPDIDATGNTGIGILKGDGQKITGLAKLGFNLIIFKEHQIHHISGCSSADFTRRQILEGGRKGCYAHRSLAKSGNTIMMLHDDAILNFNGATVQDMSINFKSKIDGIDDDYIQNACAVFYNKRYWLSYTSSGQTSNNKTLVIDSVGGACTEYDYGVNAFYLDLDNNLYGAGDSGFIRQLDTGTDDDGSNIASYWQSKYYDFGMPNITKRLKEVIVYTSLATESFTFTFYVDQNRQNWTKTVTPSSATLTEVRFSCDKKLVGKRFRLKIAHTGNESYKIHQVIFRYEPIARRGTI
jgi:hypothetical protein